MATTQQYSLRWNNYLKHITYAFDNLRSQDDFVDVTLCCDGKKIKAHKVLLSACSGYFKQIFKENPCPHPVVIFKFIKYEDLLAIIEFMYQGEVNVQQEALQSFLQTAELLAVQGLTSEEREKPKHSKTENRVIEEQLIKTLPTSIRTVTENNTQTSTVELQASILPSSGKKRKISFTEDDDDVYTETVEFSKEEGKTPPEVQYISTSINVDMPEYIDVFNTKQLSESQVQQTQQSSQVTTTQTTTQFTSEYEILAESDIDKFDTSAGNESTEITAVEIGNGQVFTVQESKLESCKVEKGSQEKIYDEQITCNVCNRHLQSISALRRHKASKHEVRTTKYECVLCQKVFKTKWSLSTHNSRFHREAKLKDSIEMEFSFK